MADERTSWESKLIDLHLGQLDASELHEVEEAVAGDPRLASKSRALRELLGLLERDETPQPPAGLTHRVLARIEAETKAGEPGVIPFPVADKDEEPVESGQKVAARGFSFAWRDVLTVAACIALFFGVAVPGFRKVRTVSTRQQCLANLGQISAGMFTYGQDNAGYYPYAGYVPGGSWLPGQKGPDASNTRHVFKLVRQGYVPNVRVFICPAAPNGQPMNQDDIQKFMDFAQRQNNSYSFLFMNLPQGRRFEDMQQVGRRRIVLIADRNPHFPESAGTHPAAEGIDNSPLHEGGAGQNAIYVDGSGGWFTTPAIGVNGDNIYRLGQKVRYTGHEAPDSETDTFLP